MAGFKFFVSLRKEDWINDIGGWHCSALKIPTARVEAIYADQEKKDDKYYKVDYDQNIIEWANLERIPSSARVGISVSDDLSTKSETVNAEIAKQKAEKAERRLRYWAIILPFVSAILVATIPLIKPEALKLYPQKKEPTEREIPIKDLGISAYFISNGNDTLPCDSFEVNNIFNSAKISIEKKEFSMEVKLTNNQVKGRKAFEFSFERPFSDSLQVPNQITGWSIKHNGIYSLTDLVLGTKSFKINTL